MKVTVTAVVVILLTIATFVGMLLYANATNKEFIEQTTGLFHFRLWWSNTTTTLASSSSSSFSDEEIVVMRQRLSPHELIPDGDQKLLPHQFLHLHHMKTGGTSMDDLIQCGVKRLRGGDSTSRTSTSIVTIPYSSVHECSKDYYAKCRSGEDQRCWKNVKTASILSYCAPFSDLPLFQWTITDHDDSSVNNDNTNIVSSSRSSSSNQQEQVDISAVTVLRHPVHRVWSMYRFRTRSCYQCRTLKEVYEAIDNGQEDETDLCTSQLLNHQTRNLASSSSSSANSSTTTAMAHELNQHHVQEAIANLKQRITMVGLTEDMETTAKIAGHAFPWLAERVESSNVTCPLQRKNASPANNGCGPNGSHMQLPDHPDDETARLIEEHNQLDLQVYEAGETIFLLQKMALGLA